MGQFLVYRITGKVPEDQYEGVREPPNLPKGILRPGDLRLAWLPDPSGDFAVRNELKLRFCGSPYMIGAEIPRLFFDVSA